MASSNIKSILKRNKHALKNKRNVKGCGVGKKKIGGQDTGKTSITVFVEKKIPASQLREEDLIPLFCEEVSTDVIEIGKIDTQLTQEEHRPIFGGISCGHPTISSGTIGLPALKTEKYGEPKEVLLSNAHVIAPHWSNNISEGDAILQPGVADGGTLSSEVAALLDWKEIDFEGENEIDAAIAECTQETDIYIPRIGNYLSLIEGPEVNMPVAKYGRTTGYTEGVILATDTDIDVNFGEGVVEFVDQILIQDTIGRPFSLGGDSGSAIFLMSEGQPTSKIVGLLFAGNESFTLANDINKVFEEFELEIIQDVPEFIRGERLDPEEEDPRVYKSASGYDNWQDNHLLEIYTGGKRIYPQKGV